MHAFHGKSFKQGQVQVSESHLRYFGSSVVHGSNSK